MFGKKHSMWGNRVKKNEISGGKKKSLHFDFINLCLASFQMYLKYLNVPIKCVLSIKMCWHTWANQLYQFTASKVVVIYDKTYFQKHSTSLNERLHLNMWVKWFTITFLPRSTKKQHGHAVEISEGAWEKELTVTGFVR